MVPQGLRLMSEPRIVAMVLNLRPNIVRVEAGYATSYLCG